MESVSSINVKIPVADKMALVEYAKGLGINLSSAVTLLIRKNLKNDEGEELCLETKEAIEDARCGRTVASFGSMDEFKKWAEEL